MKVYTARQPILNAKRRVVAYELLFRDSKTEAFPAHVAPDIATAKLLVNSYLSHGLEAITEGRPAFVNFPREMLSEHLVHMVPYKNIVIELFDDIEPNDENFQLMRQLFHKRFILAMHDFDYSDEWERFMPFIKLAKINLKKTSLRSIATLLPKFRHYEVRLMASNIESYEQFNQCARLGFHFFQGDFLYTPQVVEAKDIETSQHFLLSIYGEVMKEDFSYSVLESYFEKDMGLTYKLMRFVNSSLFEIKNEITSLKQAMIFLGENQLRKFICLIVTSQLNPNKPAALVEATVVRARLSELIAKMMGLKGEADSAFLTGLFSTIDAILDKPMEKVLESLPLGQNIRDALLEGKGELAECLQIALAYMEGNWMTLFAFAKQYNVEPNALISACDDAYDWMSTVDKVNAG